MQPVGSLRQPHPRSLLWSFRLVIAMALFGLPLVVGSAAEAQECRTNYYRCDLNRGGRVDPTNPGCCWSPAAGRPSREPICPANFYRCDLNRDGRVDPNHPGCCWNLR